MSLRIRMRDAVSSSGGYRLPARTFEIVDMRSEHRKAKEGDLPAVASVVLNRARKRPARYQLRTTEATLDPIVVLKAVACFDYQSCEHPGWPTSQAHDLMQALRTAVLERHPDLGERVKGPFGRDLPLHHPARLGARPWGIDVLEDVIPVPA